MSDFKLPETESLASSLANTPMEPSQSDKGRFFSQWWFTHHMELEGSLLKALAETEGPAINRKVAVMFIVQKVDAANGSELAQMGFTPAEIIKWTRRAMNKRLESVGGEKGRYVVRNEKLVWLALGYSPA